MASDGATCQQALDNGAVIIQEWIETAKALQRPIPEPRGRLLYAQVESGRFSQWRSVLPPVGASFDSPPVPGHCGASKGMLNASFAVRHAVGTPLFSRNSVPEASCRQSFPA